MRLLINIISLIAVLFLSFTIQAQEYSSEESFRLHQENILHFLESDGAHADLSRLIQIFPDQYHDRIMQPLQNLSVDSDSYIGAREKIFDIVINTYKDLRIKQLKILALAGSNSELNSAIENMKDFLLTINSLAQTDRVGAFLHYTAKVAKYVLIAFDTLVVWACITPAVIAVFAWSPAILAINIVLALPIAADYLYKKGNAGFKLRRSLNMLNARSVLNTFQNRTQLN